jgi:RHS repeat-associated protein
LTRDSSSGALSGTVLGRVRDQYTYDEYGEVQTYRADIDAVPVLTVTYQRDDGGRLKTVTESMGAGSEAVRDYQYDAAGRLAAVFVAGSAVAEYEYDAAGNRTAQRALGGSATATYDSADRMLTYGDTTFTYSPAGDLQEKREPGATTRYTYDSLGNLRTVEQPGGVVEYVMDAEHRRVGKRLNGQLVAGWLYADALRVVAELDGSGNTRATFAYGSRANVPDYMTVGGVQYRIVPDHLGSPRLVIDTSTGAIVQRMDFDEYGRVLVDTNPGFQPFGYAGGLYDRDTGLVRFGARDYDPQTGRWTTTDPIGVAGGDTNLYAYVLNDPVNLLDPTGLDWMDTTASFSAGLGDVLLLGAGDELREWTDETFGWNGNALVDPCSSAYSAGEWTGIAATTVAGGAAGWRAAGSKAAGKEFSHWIPDRVLKRTGSSWLRNTFGKSRFNGNYVSSTRHYLHDPHRFLLGTTRDGKFSPAVQQLDRVARVYYGAGAGAGAGASATGDIDCGCP